tara:strand:- start:333 stop:560 length:228 start_codon:yes stop_codon:yes gene_type:complete
MACRSCGKNKKVNPIRARMTGNKKLSQNGDVLPHQVKVRQGPRRVLQEENRTLRNLPGRPKNSSGVNMRKRIKRK